MFKCFYPSVYYESVYAVDFTKYYDEGFRAILFDIDNTLVRHDAPVTREAAELFKKLRDIGFRTCIVSNNSEERVAPFAEAVESVYICRARKPEAAGIEKAMELLGSDTGNTMAVGDQLFTDIWGANRAGIFSVCVRKIDRDPLLYIRAKRAGEKVVMIFYRLYTLRHKTPKYLIGGE